MHCQRETGFAFALDAIIGANRVESLAGELEAVITETETVGGHKVFRHPTRGSLENTLRAGRHSGEAGLAGAARRRSSGRKLILQRLVLARGQVGRVKTLTG